MHPDGVLLPVKILPNSKSDSFRGVYDHALKISVTAVAEHGKANKAVLAFLAKALRIAKSDLSIHAGESDCRKVIRVQGVTEAQMVARLTACGIQC